MAMGKHHLYETRPLQCWQKAKEIRAAHYAEIMSARERGKLLATGSTDSPIELLAGIGDFEYLCSEPWGATLGTSPEVAGRCAQAVEERGYVSHMCGYMRMYWGSVFLNTSTLGPFPRPDLILQIQYCDSQGKWFQVVAEELGLPYFALDFPVVLEQERKGLHLSYYVSQLHDAVEWLEKTTGRPYDDEKLIEAIHTMCRTQVLWARIAQLNQAIPAPLDQKLMFVLYFPSVAERYKKRAADFYEELLDEVQDRVEHRIAAVPTERCRLLHENVPPWYFLRIFRHVERYGAVFIGSNYSFGLCGAFLPGWIPARTPQERGLEIRSREQALQFLAEWLWDRPIFNEFLVSARVSETLKLVEDWHAEGVVFHANKGCKGSSLYLPETTAALSQRNIPYMIYTGCAVDMREFEGPSALERLESFLQGLGLTRLPDED